MLDFTRKSLNDFLFRQAKNSAHQATGGPEALRDTNKNYVNIYAHVAQAFLGIDYPDFIISLEKEHPAEYITSDFDRPDDYYDNFKMTPEQWATYCSLKDKSTALLDKRWRSAKEVIDLIAEHLGIADNGHYLYGLVDGTTPIIEKIDQYFDRGGDKVKLKKRIDELENENRVLRSLVGK